MSIATDIIALEVERLKAMARVRQLDEKIRMMNKLRQTHCKHVFSTPMPGYEHEGGTCYGCGINEIYASQYKYEGQ